jgi:hypothetical protein
MSDATVADLRELFLDDRRTADAPPRERRRRVFVDPAGRIVIGDRVPRGDEGQSLSEIHQGVFAAPVR